ncbi:hypothetical protein THAOC_18962, partial [Thalassiosira oceanica]
REGDVGVEVLELAAGEVGEDRGAEVARGRHGREGGEDGEEFHSFRSFNNEHKVAGAGGWSGGNRSWPGLYQPGELAVCQSVGAEALFKTSKVVSSTTRVLHSLAHPPEAAAAGSFSSPAAAAAISTAASKLQHSGMPCLTFSSASANVAAHLTSTNRPSDTALNASFWFR